MRLFINESISNELTKMAIDLGYMEPTAHRLDFNPMGFFEPHGPTFLGQNREQLIPPVGTQGSKRYSISQIPLRLFLKGLASPLVDRLSSRSRSNRR